jgi:hypothetical protein
MSVWGVFVCVRGVGVCVCMCVWYKKSNISRAVVVTTFDRPSCNRPYTDYSCLVYPRKLTPSHSSSLTRNAQFLILQSLMRLDNVAYIPCISVTCERI